MSTANEFIHRRQLKVLVKFTVPPLLKCCVSDHFHEYTVLKFLESICCRLCQMTKKRCTVQQSRVISGHPDESSDEGPNWNGSAA
ncbi:hypothetical protein ACUWC1_29605, partial [Klebsiella pneumoniae]